MNRDILRFAQSPGGVVLFLTIALMALSLGTITSLANRWRRVAVQDLYSAGMNRLTVTARGDHPLTENERRLLQAEFPEARIVPFLCSLIDVENRSGRFQPVLCGSWSDQDPLLASNTVLSGSVPEQVKSTPTAIVAAGILQRIGYGNPYETPASVRVRLRGKTLQLPLQAVVGELSDCGIRLPMHLLQGGSSAPEFDALHVMVRDPRSIPAIATKLQQRGFRVASPYLQRGKELRLITAAISLATPIIASLLALVGWNVWTGCVQMAEHERLRFAVLRSVGGSRRLLLWSYLMPHALWTLVATGLGVGLACALFEGPLAKQFNLALGVELVGAVSTGLTVAMTEIAAIFAMGVALFRILCTESLERDLKRGV
jgi:hypothetical protein